MRQNRLNQYVLAFNLATIFLWGWAVTDFLSRGSLSLPRLPVDLYLVLLAAYAGDKEIKRWHDRHQSTTRRGEYFVIGWTATALIMLLIELLNGRAGGYRVPEHLALITGGVLVIYFATTYLKSEYRKRSR